MRADAATTLRPGTLREVHRYLAFTGPRSTGTSPMSWIAELS